MANSTAQRAVEFEQRAVSKQPENPAGMLCEVRLDDLRPQILDPRERAALVFAEPLAVAENIGGNDCRQFPTQCHSPSEMNSTNASSKFKLAYSARGMHPSIDADDDLDQTSRFAPLGHRRKFYI